MTTNNITVDRVRELLAYNPETGVFIRRKTQTITGYRAANGHTQIGVGKTLYYAQRLAWFYTYGKWPRNRITFINGDCTDNRIKNLSDAIAASNSDEKLTHKKLLEYLSYSPSTGVFIKIKSTMKSIIGRTTGWKDSLGYIYIELLGNRYSAHRLAWFYVTGDWPVQVIDHIDGNPSNNRFDNLRDVSFMGNSQNIRHSASTKKSTELLGAYRNHDRWMSRIKVNKKDVYLGTFDTPELAHQAYLEAKRIYHPTCTI